MLCGLIGVSPLARGQSPPPGYRQFTADDGLPSSEVYEVIQDRQGYLWFATDNGVSRFNGYGFENFGALHGLDDPVVFYLQEDIQGKIWMKCMSGLLYYFEKDSLHPFAGNGMPVGSGSGANCNFYVDSTGQVFNSIYQLGLIRSNLAGNGGLFLGECLSNAIYVREGRSINIACGNGPYPSINKTTVQPQNGKLHWQLDLYFGQQKFVHTLPMAVVGGHFDSWFFDNRTLVVSGMGMLFGFEAGQLVWQIPFSEKISAWYQDRQGKVYLGLGDRKGVQRYRSVADLPLGRYEILLEGHSVAHLLEDREGGYWFATTDAGVFYLPNASVEIFDQTSGLMVNYITSIALKNGHEAYVGLEGGGAVSLDASLKRATPLPSINPRISDLAFDSQHNMLWGAGSDYNLQYFFNGNWHKLVDEKRTAQQKKQVGFPTRHLHFSHDQKTMWGVSHSGFFRLYLNKAVVDYTHRYLNQLQPYSNRTLDAYTASTGRTWIANVHGLFELKDDELLHPDVKHPAFQNRIEAIVELSDGTLVLGSKGYGLVFWKDSQLATLTVADGLTANMIENLHVDDKGTLWAGTLNGLNKIRWEWGKEVNIEKITTAHGLPSNEITDVATWGETIWVGTTKGLARFANPVGNPVSPAPILASVMADKRSLDLAQPTLLSFWENNLTINYFTINYKMNGHIPYRYRLDDGHWSHTFNTMLNFPSMPPGERVFEVQSQNEDGIWSEPVVFAFSISPPWWRSIWFWSIVALAGAIAVWSFIRYRTAQVRHEEQLKTALYKKLSETELTALRSQMNPHFIFNCLNSINHFVLRNESQQAANYISKFSKLIRLVLDNSGLQKVPLEKELEALRHYMDLEAMRFDGKFRYELWVDDEVDLEFTQVPPMLLQPYVENAIWHGLMNKPEGGLVVVDVRQPSESHLHIEIMDDGVGRKRAAELENKTSMQHKPQGTNITAERLRLLDTENPKTCSVMIHDLVDAEGQPCGTRVVLEIPV